MKWIAEKALEVVDRFGDIEVNIQEDEFGQNNY
jgi:hypothetical protein